MAGNTSNLTFKLFGKDVSASKAFRGVGSTAGGLSRGLGGLGAAFAGIGTAAVIAGTAVAIDFGKTSVDAFLDAQKSQAAFEFSMEKAKGLKVYTGRIDGLSQSLALKTKYDDDATKSAAALLSRFNLTGKQLERTIPLVQDYASATGVDLNTAASAVGKSLLGNTKALKTLGIAYKPTGDKAKDYANIMALLQKKVGGFAEREGKSAAGQAEILKNQFGELQEQVGSYLVPILSKLTQIGIKVVGWLSTAAGAVKIFFDAFTGNSELNEFDGNLQTINNAGIAFREVWDKVAGWVMGTLVPGIQNLAAAFMENVWPAIVTVAGMIAENLQPVIETLADFWTNTLLPGIQDLIPIVQKVATWIGIVVGALLVAVSWIVGKVAPVFFNVLGGAIRFVIAVLGKVVGAIQWAIDHWGEFIAFCKAIPGKIADAFKGLVSIITAPFRLAFNSIAALWNNTVGKLSFGVPDWVPGMGGKGWDVPDIPMLGDGGIVTRPTLALIGERGAEAVIPLSGRSRGAGGVTINITQPLGTPQQIGRVVLDAMRQAQGSGRAVINF